MLLPVSKTHRHVLNTDDTDQRLGHAAVKQITGSQVVQKVRSARKPRSIKGKWWLLLSDVPPELKWSNTQVVEVAVGGWGEVKFITHQQICLFPLFFQRSHRKRLLINLLKSSTADLQSWISAASAGSSQQKMSSSLQRPESSSGLLNSCFCFSFAFSFYLSNWAELLLRAKLRRAETKWQEVSLSWTLSQPLSLDFHL